MAFKMKRSPVKGKLDDFFKGLGENLRRNRRDIAGEHKGVKQKDKPKEKVDPPKVVDPPKKKVTYKEAYKNADTKKYPTLESFTTAAKAWNKKNKK
tara:strand:- start:57 stop:344 length:288 start_codon:yes stop_codon:yes gene_type:complete